jgi:hypothetical protein
MRGTQAHAHLAITCARGRRGRRPERGPVGHELPAPVEQIASPIGGLHLTIERMRERGLCDLARMIGVLRGPIAKRRTKAVRRFRPSQPAQHGAKRHVRERRVRPQVARENKRRWSARTLRRNPSSRTSCIPTERRPERWDAKPSTSPEGCVRTIAPRIRIYRSDDESGKYSASKAKAQRKGSSRSTERSTTLSTSSVI